MSASTFLGKRVDSSRAGTATTNLKREKPLATAGYGRHDGDGLPAGYFGVETFQVAHIVISDEHVHKFVQVSLIVQQLCCKSGVDGFKPLQHLTQCGSVHHYRAGSTGKWSQCGGDTNGDRHVVQAIAHAEIGE